VPNLLARSFRAGSDAAVGLAVPDLADPFFVTMTSSIELDLMRQGMAVVVTSLHPGADERTALELLLRRQISGLIVVSVSTDQSYLAPWQERTPMVFVDRAPRGLSGVYVIEDDLGGAREAVTHLAGDIPMAEAGARRHRPGSGPRRTRAHRRGTLASAHRRPEHTGATQDRAPGPADPERIGRAASASRLTRRTLTGKTLTGKTLTGKTLTRKTRR
jgi:DNA-binding LacI/PurR family transcriptional regulator